MDVFGQSLGGHITSCPRHVRQMSAMATAVAWQPRIEHLTVMVVSRLEA